MNIWHAQFTSRHFEFDAYGHTSQEALNALVAGLVSHGTAYNLSDAWYTLDDLNVREVTLGTAYRDREPIAKMAVLDTEPASVDDYEIVTNTAAQGRDEWFYVLHQGQIVEGFPDRSAARLFIAETCGVDLDAVEEM